MKNSPLLIKCVDLVKKYEGFRATPYLCPAGKPTVGYGTTEYAKGLPVMIGDPPITEQLAEEFLREQLTNFWDEVDKTTEKKLNGNQLSAVTSLAYNIGIKAFKVSTILKKILVNTSDKSIYNEFLRWNKANGVELAGLTKRRKEEADLYFYEDKIPVVFAKLSDLKPSKLVIKKS